MTEMSRAEREFLRLVRDKNGITINEALQSGISFGSGTDAIDVVRKMCAVDFLKYDEKRGKYIISD